MFCFLPTRPCSSPPQEVLNEFGVDAAQGAEPLTKVDETPQKARLEPAQGGEKAEVPGPLLWISSKSPIIALLAVAAVLAFTFQEWIEGIAVVIAIALNAIIGLSPSYGR